MSIPSLIGFRASLKPNPTPWDAHRPPPEEATPIVNTPTAADRERALFAAIERERATSGIRFNQACWTLALTVRRGIAAEIRSLSAWRRAVMEWAELEHVGLMGALKAAQKFNPGRGRFTTYARLWIRAELRRATGEQAGLMRLPENAQALLKAIRTQQQEGCLAPEAIATALQREPEEVVRLLEVTTPPLRLDAPTVAGTLPTSPPDPQPSAEHALQAAETFTGMEAAIEVVLADPNTDSLTRWHLRIDPTGVRDPITLAALRAALETLR